MDDDSLGLLRRLQQDFEFYAPRALKLLPKAGGDMVPFHLNDAQLYIHKRLQYQLLQTGKVRALILKARQQGASTYIQGRFFHRVSMNRGRKAYILTHEQVATDNLFAMAERFYKNLPAELRPVIKSANAKELSFAKLGSGYAVATAGSKDTGRSATAQLFHGSEVGFWDNAPTHMQGIGQIISNAPGTEIVLESTGNGIGNTFHQMWQTAEAGGSEYQAIFTPWFMSREYTAAVPRGTSYTVEDLEYQRLHSITDEQLQWRRLKINTDFAGDELAFQQEYPANAAEAFVIIGHVPLISVAAVMRARKAEVEGRGARVLGVDPARHGAARSAMVWRQGRKCYKAIAHQGLNTMQLVGLIAKEIQDGHVDRVFVDVIGIGAGVVDRLHELGYTEIVIAVVAGGVADEPEKYLNKRAEMWDIKRKWFEDALPAQIPDSDELQADIIAPQFHFQSNQRMVLESKQDMDKRGVRSPDLGDALAMTFAFPVSGAFDRSLPVGSSGAPRRINRGQRSWQTR